LKESLETVEKKKSTIVKLKLELEECRNAMDF
jgi:hypothetical protein